jgi:hypothetical protein
MTIRTSKPTGKPSWPITLLAGAEKTGKSWAAAQAAASPLIARTYWLGIGEDRPDEYGLIADFDIIEHDGTYREILRNVTEVAGEPPVKDETVLLVVDSMTRLWDLIKDNAQATANARARAAATRYNKSQPEGDSPISMDLWNAAKGQWNHVMDAIRAHRGPVILTARLDTVTVMGDDGKPTKQKQEKVSAEKSLPFDVGAVIEMPVRGEAYITGVRSVKLQLPERLLVKDFTIDGLWRKLGLHEVEIGERVHDAPKVDVVEDTPAETRDWLEESEKLTGWTELNRLVAAAIALKVDAETVAAIRYRRDQMTKPESSAA